MSTSNILLGNEENNENCISIKKVNKRKPNYCYSCETEVLNFAGHINRNHPAEMEVMQIFSKETKSKQRRYLFDLLRKKGNYLKTANECFKLVRCSYIPNQFLPCDVCLGFYWAKLFYRH